MTRTAISPRLAMRTLRTSCAPPGRSTDGSRIGRPRSRTLTIAQCGDAVTGLVKFGYYACAVSTTRMMILGLVRWMQPVHGYDVRRELLSWRPTSGPTCSPARSITPCASWPRRGCSRRSPPSRSRQVDGEHCDGEGEFRDHVAGGGRVDGILAGAGEAQVVRDGLWVEAQRRPGERPCPVRAQRGPAVPVAQPVDVAGQRPAVCEQMMRQQHRLGVLQVRPSWHRDGEMPLRLTGQRTHESERLEAERAGFVA